MYIIPLAWLYVVVMMSAAEAVSPHGSVLGAIITFVFYGAVPIALMLYFMRAPARRRALQAREAAPNANSQGAASSHEPDAGNVTTRDPIATVRKEL
jgi:hypothetical protein